MTALAFLGGVLVAWLVMDDASRRRARELGLCALCRERKAGHHGGWTNVCAECWEREMGGMPR